MLHYYDTSAILNGEYPAKGDYISATVIQELENIKTSAHKDEGLKMKARQAVRFLFNNLPTLFIPEEFDLNDLKMAYRKKVLQYHPDKATNEVEALEHKKHIQITYY